MDRSPIPQPLRTRKLRQAQQDNMNYDDAIDRIYQHLQNDDVEATVMAVLA